MSVYRGAFRGCNGNGVDCIAAVMYRINSVQLLFSVMYHILGLKCTASYVLYCIKCTTLSNSNTGKGMPSYCTVCTLSHRCSPPAARTPPTSSSITSSRTEQHSGMLILLRRPCRRDRDICFPFSTSSTTISIIVQPLSVPHGRALCSKRNRHRWMVLATVNMQRENCLSMLCAV